MMGGAFANFKEREEYLRDLGALDESDPKRPRVIIPNYLGGRSNCFVPSSFYSVCCIDECESLLGLVENKIASPSGAPKDIAELISHTSSDTIDAPRNLSDALLGRLNEIAAQHGGQVPLHGRLFAQWMHHAYPRECPYPHAPGSAPILMTAAEWVQVNNFTNTTAPQEMMERHAKGLGGNEDSEATPFMDIPWSEEEELVAIIEVALSSNVYRKLAGVAVIISAALSLLQTSKTIAPGLPWHSGGSAAAKLQQSHFV